MNCGTTAACREAAGGVGIPEPGPEGTMDR